MQDLFKKIYRMSIVSSVLFLLFGLLLFMQTETVIKSVSIIMGCVLLVLGIVPIVNYFKNRVEGFFSSTGLLYGIFSVVAGLIILINNDVLVTIIPILSGVWMIVNSVNKIQIAMELRDNKINSWIGTFIFSIIILIGGVFLIVNPLKSALILTKTVGIIIVVYAALDIIDSIIIKVKLKNAVNEIAEIKEVK
ncbi:MAG: HdeD family acid-resistance protein [Bacilli bacterium]